MVGWAAGADEILEGGREGWAVAGQPPAMRLREDQAPCSSCMQVRLSVPSFGAPRLQALSPVQDASLCVLGRSFRRWPSSDAGPPRPPDLFACTPSCAAEAAGRSRRCGIQAGHAVQVGGHRQERRRAAGCAQGGLHPGPSARGAHSGGRGQGAEGRRAAGGRALRLLAGGGSRCPPPVRQGGRSEARCCGGPRCAGRVPWHRSAGAAGLRCACVRPLACSECAAAVPHHQRALPAARACRTLAPATLSWRRSRSASSLLLSSGRRTTWAGGRRGRRSARRRPQS